MSLTAFLQKWHTTITDLVVELLLQLACSSLSGSFCLLLACCLCRNCGLSGLLQSAILSCYFLARTSNSDTFFFKLPQSLLGHIG